MRTSPLLYALLIGSVVVGCSDPATTENGPPDEPDPVFAVIGGPDAVALPMDSTVTVTYSAAGSSGPIERYVWHDGQRNPLGEGSTVEVVYDTNGRRVVHLKVEGSEGQVDEDTHSTQVSPDMTQGGPVLAFTTTSRAEGRSIGFMHPTTGDVQIVVENYEAASASSAGCAWNPDHTMLAISAGNDIWTLERDSLDMTKLVDTDGVAGYPDWSPDGEWIAFTDDSYDVGGSSPNLLHLVKPDSVDLFVVGGDTTDYDFHVFFPSWDPTSTLLAANADWEVEPDSTPDRIVIYSDLWGQPQRQVLHTEAQIKTAYGGERVSEGNSGVAWSPDGQWIASASMVSTGQGQNYVIEYKLAIAAADGSDDIRIILTLGSPGMAPFISWSPDGEFITFAAYVGSRAHIFRIPVAGGPMTDMSALSDEDASDAQVCF